MEFRNLGETGLRVSVIGLGCNNFGMKIDQAATTDVVGAAIDSGINFFDTADVYGGQGTSETFLGKALGERRHDVVVASKFGVSMGAGDLMKGASRRYIMNSIEATLKRLNTDYLDLYQLHFPDESTPIDETLSALDTVVRQGKVRYIGSSNFSGWQIADADWTSRLHGETRFVTSQSQYNLLDRAIEAEVVPACQRFGLGILPYFPLASGMLTGKYKRDAEAPEGSRFGTFGDWGKQAIATTNFDVVEQLSAFAEERGHTLLELAFSWLVCLPYIPSVIAGATSVDQVASNAGAGEWKLSADEMAEIDRITRSK